MKKGGHIMLPVSCLFLNFLLLCQILLPISKRIEQWKDFPAPGTVTYRNVLLPVSQGYRTHGKDRSPYIRTMLPIRSDIRIAEADYTYMLKHRSPTDTGTDPDRIAGKGYFCANVTLQQAGDAIRILHAGNWPLAAGSIAVCPQDVENRNRLYLCPIPDDPALSWQSQIEGYEVATDYCGWRKIRLEEISADGAGQGAL